MKTVLCICMNSVGHIHGPLGVADKLKDDYGAKVVFVVVGPTTVKVRAHGHELIELEEKEVYEDYEPTDEDLDDTAQAALGRTKIKYPGTHKYSRMIMDMERNMKVDPVNGFFKTFGKFSRMLFEEVRDYNETYEELIAQYQPDFIIVDVMLMPPCILKSKIPWVKLQSAGPLTIAKPKEEGTITPPPMAGFSLLRNKEARERMRKEEPAKWEAMVSTWLRAREEFGGKHAQLADPEIAEFYKKHDCEPPVMGTFGPDSPHLNIYLYPKEIDYEQEDDLFVYPKRWLRCDSLIRKSLSTIDPAVAQDWDRRIEEASFGRHDIVYFSLGSLTSANHKLMKHYLDMFANDKQTLYVVSKGSNGDKYEFPGNNMIGDNFVPQTYLLQRATMAIVHGGNNTVTECLHYGVPMIVLPAFGDQPDNAQRIEDLGLGKRLSLRDCTCDDMSAAATEILSSEEIIERAKEVGNQMRARNDLAKVSKVLKKLADEGQLDEKFIEDCKNKTADEI